MCENLSGPNAPFCSPSTNTQVRVGQTVEITWDTRFFNRSSPFGTPSTVFIQADFGSTSQDASFGGLDGFTSPPLDPQSGRFTWTIVETFLTSGGVATTSRGSRLFLSPETSQIDVKSGSTSTTVRRITGPRVVISQRENEAAPGQPPNPLSIALPVGLGAFVVLIIGIFFCVRRWKNRDRRNKEVRDVEVKGASAGVESKSRTGFWEKMFPAGGYGVGKSKTQRIGNGMGQRKKGKRKGEDIEIVHSTHMNAVGGAVGGPVRMGFTGGRGGGYVGAIRSNGNVFRAEVQRQDRGRGGDYL
ncbi:Protein of unknown function (DUF4448) domain containing protein [Naviculisporaceae sp. PSN 640]